MWCSVFVGEIRCVGDTGEVRQSVGPLGILLEIELALEALLRYSELE